MWGYVSRTQPNLSQMVYNGDTCDAGMKVYLSLPSRNRRNYDALRTAIKDGNESGSREIIEWERERNYHLGPPGTALTPESNGFGTVGSRSQAADPGGIYKCKAMVAVLDGDCIDPGVACEIGIASCRSISVIGYKSTEGSTVNNRVGFYLSGPVCNNLDEVKDRLDSIQNR